MSPEEYAEAREKITTEVRDYLSKNVRHVHERPDGMSYQAYKIILSLQNKGLKAKKSGVLIKTVTKRK